jgi:ParB family transcriptional regulator, chromosome partitioning protein
VTITNMLRLLRLPSEVQQWISENQLTTGHAKALLSLSDLSSVVEIARKIIQGSYSVRQAEMLVSRYGKSDAKDAVVTLDEVDPNVKAAIHALEQALGTRVTIQENHGKGRIELHFFSAEEMHRLYDGLMKVRF